MEQLKINALKYHFSHFGAMIRTPHAMSTKFVQYTLNKDT